MRPHETTMSELSFAERCNIARIENEESGADFFRITFPKTGGRRRGTIDIPADEAHVPNRLVGLLRKSGADIPSEHDPKELIRSFPGEAGLQITTLGWIENVKGSFALGNRVIGRSGNRKAFVSTSRKTARSFCKSGSSLNAWRNTVARQAGRSQIASVALLAALASPLMKFSTIDENFIINLAGLSSTGKSTANAAAWSVWGDPKAKPASWHVSDRKLFELAARFCDTVLVLDDAEQGEKKQKLRLVAVNERVHWIASGRGMDYSDTISESGHLPDLRFRTIALSSTPRSIGLDLRNHGFQQEISDRVRLLEIRVPPGEEGGIWRDADPDCKERSPELRSKALRAVAQKHFGIAGATWVRALTRRHNRLACLVSKLTAEFRAELREATKGYDGRIADKIGLLYAAGILAIDSRILPWSRERVMEVCRFAFDDVMQNGFGDQFDSKVAKLQLAGFARDQKRCPRHSRRYIEKRADATTTQAFWRTDDDRFLIRKDRFEELIESSQQSVVDVAKADISAFYELLRTDGVLEKGQGNSPAKSIRIGNTKRRFLVFDGWALLQIAEGKPSSTNKRKPRLIRHRGGSARRSSRGEAASDRRARRAKPAKRLSGA